MIDFKSTYNAVETPIKIQEFLYEKNTILKLAKRYEFRMGVNMGDIIYGDAQLCDGVNIATRQELTASPEGICVFEIVYNFVKSKVKNAFIDKPKEFFEKVKLVYGDNPIVTLKGAQEM